MSSSSVELHTLPGVYRNDVPAMGFADARKSFKVGSRAFANQCFAKDPDDWYYENISGYLSSLGKYKGRKIRVVISDQDRFEPGGGPLEKSIAVLKKFFYLADLFVFSAAPPWQCSYALLEKYPWPEFSYMLTGRGGRRSSVLWNDGLDCFFAWHVAMRSLIRSGKVAYLPRINYNWEGSGLRFPKLRRSSNTDSYSLARNAFLDLYKDQLVSQQLGFEHMLLGSSQHPLVNARLALPPIQHGSNSSNLILALHVPGIDNASFEDLWNIQQDEWPSFEAYRSSIQAAIDEAATMEVSERDAGQVAQALQHKYIDEPLRKLEERLKRIERIRRRKWASYVLISSTALLVTAFAPSLAGPVISGMGMVSILKVIETYFSDLERDVQLSSDAMYWLARLRQKGVNRKRTIRSRLKAIEL